MIIMNFDRIKYIRESNELTQSETAKKLNVTRSAYSLWEINKNVIPLTILNDFCNIFNVSMDYVVNNSNTKNYKLEKNILDKKEIGSKLRLIRKEMNLTQEKLANIFNTTHSAISAYENGATLIPTIFLIEFSKLSNVSMNWFCGKTNERNIL